MRIPNYILFIYLCLFTCTTFANNSPVLLDINNNKIEFTKLKGKWILINFWASWCEPCVTEIQEFNKLSAKHKNTMRIFAVNYDSLNAKEQKSIAQKYAINYPSLIQSSINKLNLGNIPVIPITYIFNPQGKLATKLYGGQTVASIEQTISDLEQR